MKIKNSRSKKKILIIVSVIVVLLAGGMGAYAYKQALDSKKESDFGSQSTNSKEATDDQKKEGSSAKKDAVESEAAKPGTGSDTSPAPQPQPGQKNAVTVGITAASQNGSLLQIRTLIEAVTQSGTCTLKLTKGSTVVTKTAPVQPTASSSTCQGFDIPVSELSSGTWNIELSFENASLKGSASGTVTIS